MKKLWLLGLIAIAACGDDEEDTGGAVTLECPYSQTLATQADYCSGTTSFAVSDACSFEVADPTRLLMTTTDYSTGAVSVFDLATNTVHADVRAAESDSIPFYSNATAYILSRMSFDRVDVLDSATLALEHQVSLADSCVTSTNPHSVVAREDGVIFVPAYGDTDVQVVDVTRAAGETLVGRIPMQQFADADGTPELGLAFSCGNTMFVAAERLDPTFAATGPALLIAVDMNGCTSSDEPLSLLSATGNPKQVRNDVRDATGRTGLVLTTGIERVDLANRTVEWQVSEEVFNANGLFGYQVQSFDLYGDATAYVAAYTDDFSASDIWRVALDGSAMTKVVTGVSAGEKTLEVVGDRLYFGDRTSGGEGVRVYDLTQDPPALIAGPFDTGLPPASMVAIP